jgi:hypothetical protein
MVVTTFNGPGIGLGERPTMDGFVKFLDPAANLAVASFLVS